MIVTSYMGLTVWNLESDNYNSTQLATNLALIDQHDHSPGNGKQIGTAGIAPNSITGSLIASNTIEFSNIEFGITSFYSSWISLVSNLSSNWSSSNIRYRMEGDLVRLAGSIECLTNASLLNTIIVTGLPVPTSGNIGFTPDAITMPGSINPVLIYVNYLGNLEFTLGTTSTGNFIFLDNFTYPIS